MPETAAAAHEPEPEPEPEVTYTQVMHMGARVLAGSGARCWLRNSGLPPLDLSACPLPRTLDQAEMLYEFAGTNDGELATSQGEYVYLLEDDGSGWALISNVSTTRPCLLLRIKRHILSKDRRC